MGQVKNRKQRQTKTRKQQQAEATASSTNGSSKKTISNGNATQSVDDDETLFDVLKSHPLIHLLLLTLIPYGIYMGYKTVVLQHADWILPSNAGAGGSSLNPLYALMGLRPPPPTSDPSPSTLPRQLLIVGSMSSGTTQTAFDLGKHLSLEVGHEDSNAMERFVRDGTASWFHGLRFLKRPVLGSDQWARSMLMLCQNATKHLGFHPNMYGPSEHCSLGFLQQTWWSPCWAKECLQLLSAEWGCASNTVDVTDTAAAFIPDCAIPFERTLLQVRNPMRNLESLVVKFCIDGVNGTVQPDFAKYTKALFPPEDGRKWNLDTTSCIETAAYFLHSYNTAMLDAVERGEIDDMYRIEDASPCDVARMAGLLEESTTAYSPNHDTAKKRCDADKHHVAQDRMKPTKNKINKGQVQLGWSDLRGGKHGSHRKDGDRQVELMMRSLFELLGYDSSLERDVIDDSAEFS